MTNLLLDAIWWLRSLHPRWRMKHQLQAVRQVSLQTNEYWRCDQGLRALGVSNALEER